MKDDIRVNSIDAEVYFASIGMGLKWYSYEELKQVVDLRQTTTAIAHVPIELAILLAEDAVEMGLAA
ncbi:MAG: hypothetical protein PVG64_00880 [Syntrophobacterales bacterium]|jgi:hypothetical protein